MAAKIDNPFFNPVSFLKKPLQKEVEKSINLAIKNMDISQKVLKIKSDEMLATIAPAAIHEAENINIEETEKDIANGLSSLEGMKDLHIPKIKIDTLAIKKSFENIFNKGMLFSIEKANMEIKKAKRDYEKMMTENNTMFAEEGRKQEEELNKAFAELEQIKIPYLSKSFVPGFKKELTALMHRTDSLKTKASSPHARIEEREMQLNDDAPSIFYNDDAAKQVATINSSSSKSIAVIKHSTHTNNKSIEIIFTPNQNKEPVKIIIEVDKD